jgi:hypothetical protein
MAQIIMATRNIKKTSIEVEEANHPALQIYSSPKIEVPATSSHMLREARRGLGYGFLLMQDWRQRNMTQCRDHPL